MTLIMTLEEFLKSKKCEDIPEKVWRNVSFIYIKEFTEYHVKKALKEASEKAAVQALSCWGSKFDEQGIVMSEVKEYFDKTIFGHGDSTTTRFIIDKDSIINSYDLDNIK